MKNFLSLLKCQFIENFSFNRKEKNQAKKQLSFIAILLLALVGGCFLSVIVNYTYYDLLEMDNKLDYYFPYVFVLAFILILLTSINKIKSSIFNSRDYDLLQSMPIKSSTIVGSKIFFNYLYELIWCAIIMIPALIIGANYLGIQGIIFGIVIVIFTPMIALVIASIIGFLLSLFLDRFKYASALMIVLYLIMIIAIFSFSFQSGNSEALSGSVTGLVDKVNSVFPIVNVVKAAITGSVNNLVFYVILNLLLFIAFSFVLGTQYKRINNLTKSIKTSNKYVSKDLSSSSKIKALVKKEYRRAFSSPMYFMNISVSGLMAIIMIVLMYFSFSKTLTSLSEIGTITPIIMMFMITFCIGMSPASASNISIEGKNYWILKSAPISNKELLKSKIIFSLSLSCPCALIASILAIVLFQVTTYMIIGLILLPLLYATTITLIGIILNMIYPKMEWVNEVTVVKQSASVLLTMCSGFVLEILAVVIHILLYKINGPVALIGSISFQIILIGILYSIIKSRYNYWLSKI